VCLRKKMCCFNRPIAHVGATRILVSPTRDGRQLTIYENVVGEGEKGHRVGNQTNFHRDETGKVVFGKESDDAKAKREAAIEEEKKKNAKNAMILPAPLKKGSKIQVLDLSKDSFSFKDLSSWFPKLLTEKDLKAPSASRGMLRTMQKGGSTLEVLSVGNYFISLAEDLSDLERIDPEVFTVSDEIKKLFGKCYPDGYGFVVCSFDPNKTMQAHPIGYIQDFLEDGRLFVPTRHQHTIEVKDKEHFDHEIYSVNTTNEGDAGMSVEEIEKSNHDLVVKHGMSANKPFEPLKSHPQATRAALKSDALDPILPSKIESLRQIKIVGTHANDDRKFVSV